MKYYSLSLLLLAIFSTISLQSQIVAQDQTSSTQITDTSSPPKLLSPEDFTNSEQIEIGEDRNDRMTINVDIPSEKTLLERDKGPYKFIIDTAAQRTVVSSELAQALALEVDNSLKITTLSGTSLIDTVYIPKLTLGNQNRIGIAAPIFKKSSLGADGILGLDSLQGQQVLFDFKAEEISVRNDQKRFIKSNPREIVVRARRRDGQLIFTNATINGFRVNVIIDTGSEVSIGNRALQKRLRLKEKQLLSSNLIDVQGKNVTAQIGVAKNLRLGQARFTNVPLAFADIATFDVLKLNKRPTLFLGMDALRKFERIAIDFADRRIYFLLPEDVQRFHETKSRL